MTAGVGNGMAYSRPHERLRVQAQGRLKASFEDDDIQRFRQICQQKTEPSDYPLATSINSNIPIYDASFLLRHARDSSESGRDVAMAEIHRCLLDGPGVFVIKNLVPEDRLEVVDRANETFAEIIKREKEQNGERGDHFAPAGKNDRIWNSFQKQAMLDPEGFVRYYSNEVLALACEAWLGPGYAVTAQTNIVKPGGKAQEPHRDYHLGFQSETTASRFPIISQIASQLLTLQLAIAHTDMPIESGPTQLLPFSQHFEYGYTAYRHNPFVEVFRESMVQLPLSKGDALFFNPALFHAAGENRTSDFERSANLLQVSACWGKPMEMVDREGILKKIWPVLKEWSGSAGDGERKALLDAVCEGYSFPTNLDRDVPPPDGHCPPTQRDMVERALSEGWTLEQLSKQLLEDAEKRLP